MATSPQKTRKSFARTRSARAGWGASLLLCSGLFLFARTAGAQAELGSAVLSEAGGQSTSGSTELTISQGQAVIGMATSGTTELSIGFLHGMSTEVSSPTAATPPFSLVGLSSLTVDWLANGNPAGALYEARLSTAADFSSGASSQTYNLNATFTSLNPNTLYHAEAAAYSTAVSSWSMFASIGSTYTLAATPGSPVGISTFSAGSVNGFTLNWSSGTLTTGYNPVGTIYLAQISTSGTFATVWASSQTANLSAAFSGLDEYVNYYTRVGAINGNGIATAFAVSGSTFVSRPFVFPGIINTVAGNGVWGYGIDGVPAVSTSMSSPRGVAVSSGGDIYFAAGQVVRKIDINGIISTFAGNGSQGSYGNNIQATSAQLNNPNGIAVDSAGNVFIADRGNHLIRKVDVYGTISTVAGDVGKNTTSGDGGLSLNAGIRDPYGIACDADANIYIVDLADSIIRKISGGYIDTIVGTKGVRGFYGEEILAASAQLKLPQSMAVDAAGNLFIADSGNYRIRKVTASDGIIRTFAGNGGSGSTGDNQTATDAEIGNPYGVSVDIAGNVFIADSNNRIRRVDVNRIITTFAGNGDANSRGDGGLSTNASIPPQDLVAAGYAHIFASDSNNYIRDISVATAAPTATPSLAAIAATPTAIQWSWSKVPLTAAYKLLTSTGGILFSGAISNRTTCFIEVGFSTNTLYSRELAAINSAGISTSAVVSTYTSAAAPLDLAFIPATSTSVYLTWNANTNPVTTNFEVSYTTSTNFTVGSDISTATLTTSTFTTVTSLASATTYYFRVRAYNGGGYPTDFSQIALASTTILQSSVTALSPSTGTIGVAFTLTGTGFGAQDGDNTRVRFGVGGSTAPILSWSDTAISGVVPLLSSGAYALAIERQGGWAFTSTAAGTFTVVTPFISTITPTYGFQGFDLTGTGFGNWVDSATTNVTLDGTAVELSAWSDTLIRGVAPKNASTDTAHTAFVVISTSIGTVQSNAYIVYITTGMRSLQMLAAGSQRRLIWPPLYYQANLHLHGAHGGKVTAVSHASVSVPARALSADTNVTLEHASLSGTDKDARDKARATAALGDMGEPIEFGPEGTQFISPVTIELPYDPASVPLGRDSDLAINYWDRTNGAWTALLTEVDMVNHRLRAQTNHFSLYQPLITGYYPAALAASAEFRLVDVYAFPNPARRGHVATIRSQVGLADEVEVRVYDISGRLVHTGAISSWHILDDGNGKGFQYTYDYAWDTNGVGSGVYIYAITAKKAGSTSIRKTGKVGVIK